MQSTVRVGDVDYPFTVVFVEIVDLLLAKSCDGFAKEIIPTDIWQAGQAVTEALRSTTDVDMMPDLWIITKERMVVMSYLSTH